MALHSGLLSLFRYPYLLSMTRVYFEEVFGILLFDVQLNAGDLSWSEIHSLLSSSVLIRSSSKPNVQVIRPRNVRPPLSRL
jgi:hypothetical protein